MHNLCESQCDSAELKNRDSNLENEIVFILRLNGSTAWLKSGISGKLQYNPGNWNLKGYGNLLPLIHASSYAGFLLGHGDTGKRGIVIEGFYIDLWFRILIYCYRVCVCIVNYIYMGGGLNQNNNTITFTVQ